MIAPPEAFAVRQYENDVKRLAFDLPPIPPQLNMNRFWIIRRLHQAQIAELRDPAPEDLSDGGEE